MNKVLIIGGNPSFRKRLAGFLEGRYEVRVAGSGEDLPALIGAAKPSMVLLGDDPPGMKALEIVRLVRQELPHSKIILLSAHQDMNATIQAMKLGAYDYLPEDIDFEELDRKIQKAIRLLTLNAKISPLKPPESLSSGGYALIGRSRALLDIYKFIGLIANSTVSVGIRGETGTGKKLMAQVIHENSPHKDGPFVTVDCTTIVETLSESTLYGHEKGSFTGAVESHRGLFEMASEGTIFLDEIADLPFTLQGKLLRFLQEKEYHRIGGVAQKKSNARIIVATNRDLYQAVAQGKFRKDLYYRMKVLTVYIPPLRERREDIPVLIQHFLHKINRDHHTGVLKIEDGAIRLLVEYDWPGNVRELENLLMLASILGKEEVILEETVREILVRSKRYPDSSTVTWLGEAEEEIIRRALKTANGNLTQAAKLLKISRPTLRSKIQKYKLVI
ncbi:MAG: sigma-54 dependent transcriptional regulator [Deltaproteobacteria bacterium]|nr:sigma-54 dependent transcriptional regulator [Deltaproteobacteria bacterium]MDA8307779.1 sigma-54 dependent transcriptional regulator [Deltaproteobacteria bacterium]